MWEAKEWDAIRKRTEVLAAEMKGASADLGRRCHRAECSSIRTFQSCTDSAARYLEWRDARKAARRAALGNDVREAVIGLSHRSRASVKNVLPLLGDEAARDWKLIRQAIERSTRELGVD